jgi:hypothetical protein
MKKLPLFALAAVSAGLIQAAETVSVCGPKETCAPPPISLGDEPARDGPGGSAGPSSTAGFSVIGSTGPARGLKVEAGSYSLLGGPVGLLPQG